MALVFLGHARVLALDGPHSRANGHGDRASAQPVRVLELVRVFILRRAPVSGAGPRPHTDSTRAHLVHVQRDLAALAYNERRVSACGVRLQKRQHIGCRNAAKRLGGLVAHHVRLGLVLQHARERGHAVRREQLAEDKCNFVSGCAGLGTGWAPGIGGPRAPSRRTQRGSGTHLNSALSSVKPAASASMAAGVPMLRSANIAR
jgi:hypothetical protein